MRGLSQGTKELIDYAYRLLEADHPQTLRQLHYAIFSRNEIEYENDRSSYRRLGAASTIARRRYRQWELDPAVRQQHASERPAHAIPHNWMVDETLQPESVSVWQNADGYIQTVKRSYRRDAWQTQERYCEVSSEKGTVLSSLRPIKEEFGITLRVCHGFGSTGMEGQIGEEFTSIGKEIVVFFLGDHDPSGHVIERDIHRRVKAASGIDFEMSRVAIHSTDIAEFNLPPQRIKDTDSRSRGFRKEFGSEAPTVELDALPAAELRRRVDEAVPL